MRRATTPFLAALLLASVGARATAAPRTEAEQRKQAERDRQRARLAERVDRTVGELVPVVGRGLLAYLDVRAYLDQAAWHEDAKAFQRSLQERLLRAGLLAFPYEKGRKVAVAYAYGKLPTGPLAGPKDLEALRARVPWLLVSRLSPAYEGGASVRLELYDTRTGKRAWKGDVAPIPTRAHRMDELVGPDWIPPRNLRILWYAIESLALTIGRGECWDVPALPIQAEGGAVHGYVFGTEVRWEDARPGDVVTFGSSGETGGHVVLLFRWAPERAHAAVLHQNWNGVRAVMLDGLGGIEANKPGQPLRVWRP